MNQEKLNLLTMVQLKELAKKFAVKSGKKTKQELISDLCKIRPKKEYTYKKMRELGHKGGQGKVYLVERNDNRFFAQKVFPKSTPIDKIELEAKLLKKASKLGISPKIIEFNKEKRYIIMELLNKSLFDHLKDNSGKMSPEIQKQIIEIVNTLNKAGIAHGDPSPLNFMFKGTKLYIIDYGFSSVADKKTVPNGMFILGFLLKVKPFTDVTKYKELIAALPLSQKKLI